MEVSYTRDDYLKTTKPYEELFSIKSPFEREQKRVILADHAKSLGINFNKLYKGYEDEMRALNGEFYYSNTIEFTGIPEADAQLVTGDWIATDYGVSRENAGKEEVACPHPIYPVTRLVNVDSKYEKIELAYRLGDVWRRTVFDRAMLANRSQIIQLANYGIGVDSENARFLVAYLSDVISKNYNAIPAKRSVSRLGWIGEKEFSPYVDGLVFDGEESFKGYYNSVKSHGSSAKWYDLAKQIRADDNVVPRIILAASFASVLVEPCSALPFFVHLWGGTETGKTVGLMLAASVWADPNMGAFIHTFNSTAVAQELSAGFVNSLPLILDELQIIKDRKDFDQMIYQLSEGVGKSRGEKTGGLRAVGTWRNCILTTGEQPITRSSSGGGAVNRIVEISCEDKRLFKRPKSLVNLIRNNYGFAGRDFVNMMLEDGHIEEAIREHKELTELLNKSEADDANNATEKQSMAAALILTADIMATRYLFKDNNALRAHEIAPYLSTKGETDQNIRAYAWLWDWIAANQNKFIKTEHWDEIPNGEVYGKHKSYETAIVKTVFDAACTDAGYNPSSFLDWLARTGKIRTSKSGGYKVKTCTERIGSITSRCVCVKDWKQEEAD